MHPANIPEEIRAQCYCPSCGAHLVPGKCADPLSICLACEGDHRFFIMPQAPLAGDTATAASASFHEIRGLTPEAIASFWLSDPHARSVLNDQLAQLLRATLESRRVVEEPRFSFCPICGNRLAEYDQPDIWVQGLRCQGGHSWALRGGRFFSTIASMRLELQAEHSDDVASRLIAAWLKGNPHLETNLHESVRRVLIGSPLCPRNAIRRSD